jgi:MYG1 exonuclease
VQASKVAGEEFLNRLDHYGNSWLPARDIVVAALNARKQVDLSGKIVLFDKFAPWKVGLHTLYIELELI